MLWLCSQTTLSISSVSVSFEEIFVDFVSGVNPHVFVPCDFSENINMRQRLGAFCRQTAAETQTEAASQSFVAARLTPYRLGPVLSQRKAARSEGACSESSFPSVFPEQASTSRVKAVFASPARRKLSPQREEYLSDVMRNLGPKAANARSVTAVPHRFVSPRESLKSLKPRERSGSSPAGNRPSCLALLCTSAFSSSMTKASF